MTYHKHQVVKVIKGDYAGCYGTIESRISSNQDEQYYCVKITSEKCGIKQGTPYAFKGSEIKPVRFRRGA